MGVTYTARALAEAISLDESDFVVSNSVTIVTPLLDYSTADYNSEYA